MAIQKVGVVGCGLMGHGIAQVSAMAGFPTVVREVSPNALEKGLGMIQKSLSIMVEKAKLTAEAKDQALANLTGTVELKDLALKLLASLLGFALRLVQGFLSVREFFL